MDDWGLYEVNCGRRISGAVDRYYVVAKDIGQAMALVFARHKAKIMDDLPKPFDLHRVDGDVLVQQPKRARR